MGNLRKDEKLTESKQDKCNKVRSLIITPLKNKDKDETIHSAPGLRAAVSWGLCSRGLAKSVTSDILGFCAAVEHRTTSHREPGGLHGLGLYSCCLTQTLSPFPACFTVSWKHSLGGYFPRIPWRWHDPGLPSAQGTEGRREQSKELALGFCTPCPFLLPQSTYLPHPEATSNPFNLHSLPRDLVVSEEGGGGGGGIKVSKMWG